MKKYKVYVPLSIDGETQMKMLRVNANSMTEAYLAGLAWVKKSIELLEYPNDEIKPYGNMSAGYKPDLMIIDDMEKDNE